MVINKEALIALCLGILAVLAGSLRASWTSNLQILQNGFGEVFNQLDKDSDQVVILDEVRAASIDVNFNNKIVDLAFKSPLIKNVLAYGDRNGDRFISEDDFWIPENSEKLDLLLAHQLCGGECKYVNIPHAHREWILFNNTVPTWRKYWSSRLTPVCAESFGDAEGEVFCRMQGFKGLQLLSSIDFDEFDNLLKISGHYSHSSSKDLKKYRLKFQCQGNETNIEDCSKAEVDDSERRKIIEEYDEEYHCPFGINRLASITCHVDTQIGPIQLVGAKEASMGQLIIGDKTYNGHINLNMAKVVCKELGFNQGVPKVLGEEPFFDEYLPAFGFDFVCNGSEAMLRDCHQTLILTLPPHWRDDSNYFVPPWRPIGIICNPVGYLVDACFEEECILQNGMRDACFDEECILQNGMRAAKWETYGRHLLTADTNADEKVSVEELETKAKKILESAFHLLDQNNDGSFTVEDFTTLSIKIPELIDVINQIFEVYSGGKGEIDPRRYSFYIPIFGLRIELDLERNYTWPEISKSIDSSQYEGVLGLLAKHLDTNHDGLIQSLELENFNKMVLNNLDIDQSSTITLEDVLKFMKKSQFTCLQIEGVRTFMEGWMELIITQLIKLLDYSFTYLDLDSNGEISLDQFLNMTGCNQMEPNDRCIWRKLMAEFYLLSETPLLPNMKYMGGNISFNRVFRTSYMNGDIEVEEKIANSFCLAMQPTL